MKSTGIVRKVDDLGRVVLPIELRRTMDIDIGDPLEVYVDGQVIMLKKYTPGCIFCGEVQETHVHKGKHICPGCRTDLERSAGGANDRNS